MSTCPICQVEYVDITISCHHSFCSTCIHKWISESKRNVSCPLCRRPILKKDSSVTYEQLSQTFYDMSVRSIKTIFAYSGVYLKRISNFIIKKTYKSITKCVINYYDNRNIIIYNDKITRRNRKYYNNPAFMAGRIAN